VLNQFAVELERLQTQVSQLQPKAIEAHSPASSFAQLEPVGNLQPDTGMTAISRPGLQQSSTHMSYLVQQLGFDAQTARAILLAVPKDGGMSPQVGLVQDGSPITEVAATQSNVLYETAMVDQILAELEAEMAAAGAAERQGDALPGQPSVEEYQLLSRYFVSAALPALTPLAEAGQVTQP